jgi:hypothetical protein
MGDCMWLSGRGKQEVGQETTSDVFSYCALVRRDAYTVYAADRAAIIGSAGKPLNERTRSLPRAAKWGLTPYNSYQKRSLFTLLISIRQKIQGSVPPGTVPPGTVPPGTVPPGTVPPGGVPPGSVPPGIVPPGTVPPGTVPPGTGPPGSVPPGTVPPGTVPLGSVVSDPRRSVFWPTDFPDSAFEGLVVSALATVRLPASKVATITCTHA